MNTQRIKAAARLYGKLGQSNIVRREELKPNDPPLATPLTHEYWSKPRTVRGTLPISVVSGKIGELWGIRDITEDYDTSDFGQEPEASVDMPLPALHRVPDRPTVSSDSNSSMAMPMPLLSHSRKGQQSMNISSGVTQFDDTHSPLLNSIQPPMPGSGFAPNVGGMYPPNPQPPQISAAPMGFNPMLLSSQSPYPPFPAYPPSTIGFGPVDPSIRASFVPPPMPGSPSHPQPQQHQQHPYGGVSEAAPYSNPIFQQQIIQFQEQQRQQQQQFFEQLSRQYSQMAVPHQEAFYSATMSNVPQVGSLYPPHLPPTLTPNITTAASVSQQSSAEMEHPTLELADTPTLPVSAEQGEQPASSALNRQNTVASEDIMLATVDRLEQMTLSQQTSSPAEANVAETQAGEQQQQQPEHDPPIAPPQTTSTQSDTATHDEPQPDESAHVDVQSPDNASERQPDATGRSSPPPNYEDLLPPDYEVPTTQPPPYNAAERRSRRLHEY
ncbi:hypothetical protein GGI23_004538 [Coemansia sp. RSA 2559]|nr:hypothetical protein GGI23_004538 [Coemansia sp. RSA 2559]